MQLLKKIVLFFIVLTGIVSSLFLLKRNHFGVSRRKSHQLDYDLQLALKQENVVPVVVVGSGPAGLSAALYVARAGVQVFSFAGPMPCGQLTQTTYVENWPGRQSVLGMTLMNDIKQQAESFGATIVHDSVTNIDFSAWPFTIKTDDGRSCKALSIILATGATPKALNIPGEAEYWGKGVTTCAVCDAFFFKGKEVVIAGGGDSALEMVFELIPYAKKITVLVRKGSMKANQAGQKKIASYPNVQVQFYKEITHIYGDGQTVTAIDVYDNRTKTTQNQPIDGVFLAIGHTPNNQLLQSGPALDDHGYLKMQERSQETSIPGVFAAGEIQDPFYKQAIVAAGEGAKAALDATEFLYEIGFSPELGMALNRNFFENFSDVRIQLQEISTNEELHKKVFKAAGLVVLDFYSLDCPGCMKMLPVLEAIASKLQGKVTILKTNMANIKKTIYKTLWFEPYNIQVKRIPAMVVFKDGKFQDMTTELYSKRELMDYLQKFL